MKRTRFAFSAVPACLLLLASPRGARAEGPQEPVVGSPATSPTPDVAPRPWLYLDDPSLPAPLHVIAFTRATYAKDESPTRPFGANLSRPGGILEGGAEVGLFPKLSLAASGFGGGDQMGFGALAGLRFEPFAGLFSPSTHLVFSGGYLRELNGGDGAWARVGFAQDISRLRLGATVHGEHVFATGRDAVDILVMAGASYNVVGPLRAGLEYVAQDLEESFSDEAEGGVRQFLGPQVALELLDKRLSIGAGPAMGLNAQSPKFSGRFALAYEY
jgi:hypothetical protein